MFTLVSDHGQAQATILHHGVCGVCPSDIIFFASELLCGFWIALATLKMVIS
jgi:hypothetical protein